MARTSAIVGTATATRNAVDRRQAGRNAQAHVQAMNSALAQQAPPPQPVPVAAASAAVDPIERLERLGALYAQGLLTDDEFAAAKQQLLAS